MRPPSPAVRIMAAASLLALALIGLVVREGAARAAGQEVIVEISGYDPRALLTGHYVQFQIRSEQPLAMPCPPGAQVDGLRPGGWVALTRRADRHVATGTASTREAALRLGQVAARGGLVCERTPSFQPPSAPGRVLPEVNAITLFLGVDRFHAAQEQAEALQRQLQGRDGPRQPAFVVLSVDARGKARLKGLIVAGQRTDLDWF